MIERLFRAGADVFRLNFSHGTYENHAANVAIVRALEEAPAGQSACWPTCRAPNCASAGSAAAASIWPGPDFRLDMDPTPGDVRRVQLPHTEIMAAAASGTTLLLDDGKVRLRVAATAATTWNARC